MVDDRADYEEALRQGHSYSWDQRWPEAIAEFQKAIAEASDEPAPYAGLGMAYFELGELEKALDSYKLAARYSRGDMVYLKHVADVQERLGQLSEAGHTYMAMGEIQLRHKKLDEAVGNWLRAVRLEPNLVGGHQRLAVVYRRQGLTRNAIREYLAVARIFHMRGDKQEALRVCQAALELDPRNLDVRTAMDLIRQGEDFILEEDQDVSQQDDLAATMTEAIERLTTVWEADRTEVQPGVNGGSPNPMEIARLTALQQLAREIFAEEDELNEPESRAGLSKLEQDALISQALDFETRAMADEAISCFQQAIAGGLTSSAAHYCLALLYLEKRQAGQAAREFQSARGDENYRLGSEFGLGEVYKLRGDLNRAVEHFLTALEMIDRAMIGPEQSAQIGELYERLAESLIAAAEPEKAADFVRAVSDFLDHDNWELQIREVRERLDRLSSGNRPQILGDVLTAGSVHVLESLHLSQQYADNGNYDSAVEEAYRAIQLSPFFVPGHVQLAELMAKQDRSDIAAKKYLTIADTYNARGDVNGALENYEHAVDLSPMDLSTRARLIELLVSLGYIDRALEHFMDMGETFYNLADVDRARGAYVEALKLASSGSTDNRWRLRLLGAIADIDMQRLDWRQALIAYKEIGSSEPDDERVSLTLVDLYFKAGQPGNALRQLDSYLIHLVRNGQSLKVVELLEELTEQRPAEVGLNERLVRLYIQQGRKRKAVELLDRLGERQLDAGETEKAAATIDRILELDPPNAASYRQLSQRLRGTAG